MIVDIADKLLGRFIQFFQHRKEQKQEVFAEFIEPAIADFEELHKNYVESFKSYRKLVSESRNKIDSSHPVFNQIREDSLFSSEMRSKIASLHEYGDDKTVGSFAKAVANYVLGQELYNKILVDGYRPPPNSPRQKVVDGLKKISAEDVSEKEKKERAIAAIDRVIEERQADYFHIMREYTKLRTRLLTPELKLRED